MKKMVPAAIAAAKKMKMTDQEYIDWWDIGKSEPAPFGPCLKIVGKLAHTTRMMLAVKNGEGETTLKEIEANVEGRPMPAGCLN